MTNARFDALDALTIIVHSLLDENANRGYVPRDSDERWLSHYVMARTALPGDHDSTLCDQLTLVCWQWVQAREDNQR